MTEYLTSTSIFETLDDKTTIFNYISDLKVNNFNIETIVNLGGCRWKIKNEGFNKQKMVLLTLVIYVLGLILL